MKEIERSNDPVRISWVEAVLRQAGIEVVVLDQHASVVQGSLFAIRRRVMVEDDDFQRAKYELGVAIAALDRKET